MKTCFEIKFFPCINSDVEAKNELNEEIVHGIINHFNEESQVIKKQKLLIYFGFFSSCNWFRLKSLGTVKVRGIDEYWEFIKEVINHEPNKIDNLENFKYLVYLSSDIRKCDDKKYKVFTIAHELQHVLQFIEYPSTCLRKKHSVLLWYFDLNTLPRHKLPMEHDAIRKAKLINYRMFAKKDVDSYIEENINKSMRDDEKFVWEITKSINVDFGYDWKNGVIEFWRRYKTDIEKKVKRLSEKVELKENERAFLNAYNNYLKECE